MSTVPIARSKIETKWEGEALPRQSRREDSSAWRLHVAHIEKEIERVVTQLSVLLAEARACCWDGGLGQEFLVNCAEQGRTRHNAPPRYSAIIHRVGPDEDEDVIVEIEWVPPEPGQDVVVIGDGKDSRFRQLRGRLPHAVFPQKDKHMIRIFDLLRSMLTADEVDWLSNPPGAMTTGGISGWRPRKSHASAMANDKYRPPRFDRRLGRFPGIVHECANFVARQCQMSSSAPYICTHVHSVHGETEVKAAGKATSLDAENQKKRSVVGSDDEHSDWDIASGSDDDGETESEREQAIQQVSADDDADKEYEQAIEETSAATRLGSSIHQYWLPAFEQTEFCGYIGGLWRNRSRNDLKFHTNGITMVLDSATGDGKRQDLKLRTIDVVTDPNYRGMGHARRTVHAVVRRMVANGLTVQATPAEQGPKVPIVKILRAAPARVVQIGNMFTLSKPDEETAVSSERQAPPAGTVDRRSSRRVNPADIRVTWLSPCVSSPALHPDNGQVRVIGSIDDVQMQQYVVDTAAQVLKYLSRLSKRVGSTAPKDPKDMASNYACMMEHLYAMRILGHDMSVNSMRRELKLLHEHELVFLHGCRIVVREKQVLNHVRDAIKRVQDVQTIYKHSGEGAYMPLDLAVPFALTVLRKALKCQSAENWAVVAFNPIIFRRLAKERYWPMQNKLETISNVRRYLALPEQQAPLQFQDMHETSTTVTVTIHVEGYPHAAGDFRRRIREKNEQELFVQKQRYHQTVQSAIQLHDVQELFLVMMADHGTRWHDRRAEKAAVQVNDGPLAKGGTIQIMKVTDAHCLSESTAVNAIPVMVCRGKDNARTIAAYTEELVRSEEDVTSRLVYDNDGTVFKIRLERAYDGACRRSLVCDFNAAKDDPNEHCNCKKCLMKSRYRHICQARHLEEHLVKRLPFSTEMRIELGLITSGEIVRYFQTLQNAAWAINIELGFCYVYWTFAKEERGADEWDVQIFDKKQWTPVQTQKLKYKYGDTAQRYALCRDWLQGAGPPVQISKLNIVRKKMVTELNTRCKETDFSYSTFMKELETEVSRCDTDYRTYSSNNKRPIRGLQQELQDLIDEIWKVEMILAKQRTKLDPTLWDEAVKRLLDQIPRIEGKALHRHDMTPWEALRRASTIREAAQDILSSVKHHTEQQQQERPALPSSCLEELTEFLHNDGLYRLRQSTNMPRWLKLKLHGVNGPCVLDKMPWIDPLHLYLIRGWSTILSCIGVKFWVEGQATRLILNLRDHGVASHYHEGRSKTLQFGGFSSKGFDCVKLLLHPRECFAGLGLASDQIADGVEMWGFAWFVVSCPHLHDPEFLIGKVLCDWTGRTTVLEAAKAALNRCSTTNFEIFYGEFGGIVMTPNNHTALHDIHRLFCESKGNLWRMVAEAIERCQQIARDLAATCVFSKTPQTLLMQKWLAKIASESDLRSAEDRALKNRSQQLRLWNGVRLEAITRAIKTIDDRYRLPDGRYMCDVDMTVWDTYLPTVSPVDEYSKAYGRCNRGKDLQEQLDNLNARSETKLGINGEASGPVHVAKKQKQNATEKEKKKPSKEKKKPSGEEQKRTAAEKNAEKTSGSSARPKRKKTSGSSARPKRKKGSFYVTLSTRPWGMSLGVNKLTVTGVDEDSAAERAGVQRGMVLTSVGGVNVVHASTTLKLMTEAALPVKLGFNEAVHAEKTASGSDSSDEEMDSAAVHTWMGDHGLEVAQTAAFVCMPDGRVMPITKAPPDWMALGGQIKFVDSDSSSEEEVDADMPAGSPVRFSVRRKRRRAVTDDGDGDGDGTTTAVTAAAAAAAAAGATALGNAETQEELDAELESGARAVIDTNADVLDSQMEHVAATWTTKLALAKAGRTDPAWLDHIANGDCEQDSSRPYHSEDDEDIDSEDNEDDSTDTAGTDTLTDVDRLTNIDPRWNIIAYVARSNRLVSGQAEAEPSLVVSPAAGGMSFETNSRVEVMIETGVRGQVVWYPGTVLSADAANDTYMVRSDDDRVTYTVSTQELRSVRRRQRASGSAQYRKQLEAEVTEWSTQFMPGVPGVQIRLRDGVLWYGYIKRCDQQDVIVQPLIKVDCAGGEECYMCVGGAEGPSHRVEFEEVLAGELAPVTMRTDRNRNRSVECFKISTACRVRAASMAQIQK